MTDSKERFSGRAGRYAQYRPGYPAEAVDWIISQTGIEPGAMAADIGSGTGKFTRLLLERGYRVQAVEPNQNMREAAEQELSGHPGFTSLPFSAEETGIAGGSVDLITSAQAFHWFDREKCKAEWKRILKPGGMAVLVWNARSDEYGQDSGLMAEYGAAIKKWSVNYPFTQQDNMTPAVYAAFFGGGYEEKHFHWRQPYTYDELLGFSLSKSYAPLPGHEHYEPLAEALKDIMERYGEGGVVYLQYQTEVILGRL